MNKAPRFQGVTEETFNSLMRWGLVMELKGRFLPAHDIARLFPGGGNEACGVFQCDPQLKEFLKESVVAAAFLRRLEGFLKTHSEADCRMIIENYVTAGGDGGLTKEVLREAYGLPPRPRQGRCEPWCYACSCCSELPSAEC